MTSLPASPFMTTFFDSAAASPVVADTVAALPDNSPSPRAATVLNSALEAAMPADTGAAPDLSDRPAAAPAPIAEPLPCKEVSQDAPAVEHLELPKAAGATDVFGSDISDVHEIFYAVRQMINEEARDTHRFRLDVAAFEAELEELPMFLQRPA